VSGAPVVWLAVSGHGYGHAVRSAQVAQALLDRGARVIVRTEAPRWLFPQDVSWVPPLSRLDVGVAQRDGLEIDIEETRRRWRAFMCNFAERAESEAALLKRQGVDVVVSDIPPLAFAAAAHAGVPCVGVGNFTWDWIYADWPDFEDVVDCVRAGYASADLLLRLPFHSDAPDAFSPFKHVEDVPLIARKAGQSRSEVRCDLGLSQHQCVALLSFGGFNARALNLEAFGEWGDYVFLVTPPLPRSVNAVPANVRVLNETPADYVSLIAACDVVVTKPGYGIVADCLANRVAMLFTDRGPFREYAVLAAALPQLGRATYIPSQDLIRGDVGPYLQRLLALNTPWTDQPMNGAEVVARRVLEVT
jgi:UDP:flavonoid glycosyltransferase YjiC (YdhE family)